MRFRFSSSIAIVALSMAFVMTPALLDMTSPFAIDSAYAKNGGNGNSGGNSGSNGNGNSGGNGNENSNTKSEKTNSSKTVATGTPSKTKTASKLGALNAAHASAKAFANALPNSRVGKIRAYYFANQVALSARATAEETDATALHDGFLASGPIAVVNAYEALQANPTNPFLQEAYNQAAATLTGEQIVAVEAAYSDWQSAANADALAANAAAEAQAALDAAANKKPVSTEARAAVDALLAGKFN